MSKRKIARTILKVLFLPIVWIYKIFMTLIILGSLSINWLYEETSGWSWNYDVKELKKIWSSSWLTY